MTSGYVQQTISAVQEGTLPELLAAATSSFKSSKDQDTGEFRENAKEDLEKAILYYTKARKKSLLSIEQWEGITLQLAKVHANLAVAVHLFGNSSSLVDPSVTASYHVKESANLLVEYRNKATVMAAQAQVDAFKKLDDVAQKVSQLTRLLDSGDARIELAKTFSYQLLGGETSSYEGAHLPRARMHLFLTQEYSSKALRKSLMDGTMDMQPVFNELENVARQGLSGDYRKAEIAEGRYESLRGWNLASQAAFQACDHLRFARFHLNGAKKKDDGSAGAGRLESPEQRTAMEAAHRELAQSISFLGHRGRLVVQLLDVAREQFQVMCEAEFDFERATDLCDRYLEVRRQAENFWATNVGTAEAFEGFLNANQKYPDVEFECITTYFLAVLYDAMQFKEQARKLHKQVVLQALSLDPECADYTQPSEQLRRRSWFTKSQQYVLREQQADAAAEERATAALREKIRPELDACRAAEGNGIKALLKHIFTYHCPPGKVIDPCVNVEASIPKANFLRMMSSFHPDRLPADTTPEKRQVSEEITKMLNNFYERIYK